VRVVRRECVNHCNNQSCNEISCVVFILTFVCSFSHSCHNMLYDNTFFDRILVEWLV